jgi:DNA-3-methyladenine glycosylase II
LSNLQANEPNSKPHYWEEAVKHLIKKDRIMKRLIPLNSLGSVESRGDPFMTLARSIVGQQISIKAAETVWQRVLKGCGRSFTPLTIQRLGLAGLRTCGLSQRKAEYVSDLAEHFKNKQVNPQNWGHMQDEEVINELIAIRGIGRWTAQMYLIFNLQRPNILPLDDVGLLKAISLHYFSGEPVSRFEAREVAEAWAPWCTVATWYLWRSLEPLPVEY